MHIRNRFDNGYPASISDILQNQLSDKNGRPRIKGIVFHPDIIQGMIDGRITEFSRATHYKHLSHLEDGVAVFESPKYDHIKEYPAYTKYGPYLYLKDSYDTSYKNRHGIIKLEDIWFERVEDFNLDKIKPQGFDNLEMFINYWNSVNNVKERWAKNPYIYTYRFQYIGKDL